MSQQHDQSNLSQPHDEELAPPWEVFPTYERYTIGWRMGPGESYRHDWYDYLETLPPDYESRLEYLRRHAPAPLNWCNAVLDVLYPEREDNHEPSESEIAELLRLGVTKYDAAYQTWLNQQTSIAYPWQFGESPEVIARYRTREFWFFSRQWYVKRTDSVLVNLEVPAQWQAIEPQVRTGLLEDVDSSRGLFTLAQMLCAHSILPPWSLGLSLEDFEDSFEMDMGYVDAYRLWMMHAFDDDQLLRQMLAETGIPADWEEWIEEQACFG